VISFAACCVSGQMGYETGAPYPVISRVTWGVWGANFPAIVRGIVAIAWYGIQTYLASISLELLLMRVFPVVQGWDASFVGLRMSTGKVLEGSGGHDAGGIWKSAMSEALKDIPASNFQEPNKRILEGEKVPVPNVAGMTEEQARQTLEAEGFSVGRTEQFSPQTAGTYLGKVFPSTRAAKYSTVQLVYSKGPIPTDTPTVAPGQPGQPSAPATPEGER